MTQMSIGSRQEKYILVYSYKGILNLSENEKTNAIHKIGYIHK